MTLGIATLAPDWLWLWRLALALGPSVAAVAAGSGPRRRLQWCRPGPKALAMAVPKGTATCNQTKGEAHMKPTKLHILTSGALKYQREDRRESQLTQQGGADSPPSL